jgi:hypothetical protein
VNRLILCAGPAKREGWLTLDGNPANRPDFLATIPPLPEAVRLVKWDEIEWVHGIGSLDTWEAKEVLFQLREVMEPEGLLVLEQPNLLAAAEAVLRDPAKAWWMFGDPTHRDPLMMNRWAYTPESLAAMLEHAGFRRISAMAARHHGRSERDFRVEARP